MIPSGWVEKIFSRLTAIYGSRMSAMWGDVPHQDVLEAWQHGLRNVDGERIGAALERVAFAHPEWPPTMGEFLALTRTVPAHKELLRLPAPDHAPIDPKVKARIAELTARWRM